MAQFSSTDSWRMMQILHTNFRSLAPDVLADPRMVRSHSSSLALSSAMEAAAAMEHVEEGSTADYQLMAQR